MLIAAILKYPPVTKLVGSVFLKVQPANAVCNFAIIYEQRTPSNTSSKNEFRCLSKMA